MSYVSQKKSVPVKIAKELIAELCLHRANAQWINQAYVDIRTDIYAGLEKAEIKLANVHGAFAAEDEVFLEAYLHCRPKEKQPRVKTQKDMLIVVKGGLGKGETDES